MHCGKTERKPEKDHCYVTGGFDAYPTDQVYGWIYCL